MHTCGEISLCLRPAHGGARPSQKRSPDEAQRNPGLTARDITRARKAADEARQFAVEQLKQVRYFWKQAHWLTERFPEAKLRDVDGLVKLVTTKEIEANDWSLTPGRYVGVAPEEEDEDFDFEETLREIHVELEDLNAEAVTLAASIKRNFEELGGVSWNAVNLGELIEIKHGFSFKGAFFADEGKQILLTPGNCHESGGLKLKGTKEKYYTTGDILEEYLLSAGELLVVMTDLVNTAPILGGAFVIPEDDRFLHNQRLGLVTIKDESRIHKEFLSLLSG